MIQFAWARMPTGAQMERPLVIEGDGIRVFRLLAMRSAMKLELKTGMKTSQHNVFQIVRKEFGITARKREAVYNEFLNYLKTQGIES